MGIVDSRVPSAARRTHGRSSGAGLYRAPHGMRGKGLRNFLQRPEGGSTSGSRPAPSRLASPAPGTRSSGCPRSPTSGRRRCPRDTGPCAKSGPSRSPNKRSAWARWCPPASAATESMVSLPPACPTAGRRRPGAPLDERSRRLGEAEHWRNCWLNMLLMLMRYWCIMVFFGKEKILV